MRRAGRLVQPAGSSSLAEFAGFSADVAGLVRRIVRCCTTCPAGITSTEAYDVNASFMQLGRHGWDIHAV
jgi:hypothetical protein